MEMLCAAGVAPPMVYAKVRDCGDTESDAVAPVITSVTLIVIGLLEAAEDAICTVPLYVPGASTVGMAVTVRVDGDVPDAADRLIHESLAVAVHAIVVLPPLPVMPMDWVSGTLPPVV